MCGSERGVVGSKMSLCVQVKQSVYCDCIGHDFSSCRSGVPNLPAMDLLGTGLQREVSSG